MIFLELFLQTVEKHFMGHLLRLYQPAGCRACVPLWEGWRVVVLEVCGTPQWQDVSMRCKVMISCFWEQHFLHEMDDLVCVDADLKFCDHMGVEILSALFGTLYHSFYWVAHEDVSYKCRPQS
ncbi:hypothetical protein GH733_017844 [Mirounga leonina]|nr:hypothetical protein GH733_017844 [Mirounga leonina]